MRCSISRLPGWGGCVLGRDGVDVGGIGGERQLRALAPGRRDHRIEDFVDLARCPRRPRPNRARRAIRRSRRIASLTRSSIGPASLSMHTKVAKANVAALFSCGRAIGNLARRRRSHARHAWRPARWRRRGRPRSTVARSTPTSEERIWPASPLMSSTSRAAGRPKACGSSFTSWRPRTRAALVADVPTNADGRTDSAAHRRAPSARRPVRARLPCRRLFPPPGRGTRRPAVPRPRSRSASASPTPGRTTMCRSCLAVELFDLSGEAEVSCHDKAIAAIPGTCECNKRRTSTASSRPTNHPC